MLTLVPIGTVEYTRYLEFKFEREVECELEARDGLLIQQTIATIVAMELNSSIVCSCDQLPQCCSLIDYWVISLSYYPDPKFVHDSSQQLVNYSTTVNTSRPLPAEIIDYYIGGNLNLYYNICPLQPLNTTLLELCQHSVNSSCSNFCLNYTSSSYSECGSGSNSSDLIVAVISYSLSVLLLIPLVIIIIYLYRVRRQLNKQSVTSVTSADHTISLQTTPISVSKEHLFSSTI